MMAVNQFCKNMYGRLMVAIVIAVTVIVLISSQP